MDNFFYAGDYLGWVSNTAQSDISTDIQVINKFVDRTEPVGSERLDIVGSENTVMDMFSSLVEDLDMDKKPYIFQCQEMEYIQLTGESLQREEKSLDFGPKLIYEFLNDVSHSEDRNQESFSMQRENTMDTKFINDIDFVAEPVLNIDAKTQGQTSSLAYHSSWESHFSQSINWKVLQVKEENLIKIEKIEPGSAQRFDMSAFYDSLPPTEDPDWRRYYVFWTNWMGFPVTILSVKTIPHSTVPDFVRSYARGKEASLPREEVTYVMLRQDCMEFLLTIEVDDHGRIKFSHLPPPESIFSGCYVDTTSAPERLCIAYHGVWLSPTFGKALTLGSPFEEWESKIIHSIEPDFTPLSILPSTRSNYWAEKLEMPVMKLAYNSVLQNQDNLDYINTAEVGNDEKGFLSGLANQLRNDNRHSSMRRKSDAISVLPNPSGAFDVIRLPSAKRRKRKSTESTENTRSILVNENSFSPEQNHKQFY